MRIAAVAALGCEDLQSVAEYPWHPRPWMPLAFHIFFLLNGSQLCMHGGKGDVIALEGAALLHRLSSSASGRPRIALTILPLPGAAALASQNDVVDNLKINKTQAGK